MKVTQEQFQDWKTNQVTQAVYHQLNQERHNLATDLADDILNGAQFLADPNLKTKLDRLIVRLDLIKDIVDGSFLELLVIEEPEEQGDKENG